ncbi:MAG TPA: hypothetical protein VFA43_09365 [Gemmatimonadaceae bacterium]|nr:hypothetical protein [Gemmatimonadaceae bacterium]
MRPTPGDTAPLTVMFTALTDSGPQGLQSSALVTPLTANAPSGSVAVLADAQREAAVQVILGPNAGTAKIVIALAGFTSQDTATFTKLPGAAASLTLLPHDTAVYVGGTVTYRSTTRDREGNPRNDTVSFSPKSPFTGQTIGRSSVTASAAGFTDTAFISVVPHGTLVASDYSHILMFSLDGTHLRSITSVTSASDLFWSPSGGQIAYVDYSGGSLFVTDTLGDVSVAAPGGDDYVETPQYSPDGSWLYYTYVTNGDFQQVWRVKSTDASTAAEFVTSVNAMEPSPSPDGTKLAMLVGVNNSLVVYDTASGDTATTGATNALTPVWMPGGSVIAYVMSPSIPAFNFIPGQSDAGSGPIYLINANGSGNHQLSAPGATYSSRITWSADGQWIVARNLKTLVIDVIQVSSGLTLPLPYTSNWYSPAWQPGSGVSVERVSTHKRHR